MESSIQLNDVSFTYPNGLEALKSINLSLPKGKKIALLGGNGAGKSTLMLLLNGILKPTSGFLKYENSTYKYNKKGLRALRSKVGLLFPESDNQLIAPTVYEEISFGLLNLYTDNELVKIKTDAIINEFSLQEFVNRPPHQLSSGQKKRICLAAILAMEPEFVVCDEPASNLDPNYSDIIFTHLDHLKAKGKTILIATHDVNQAYSWADYVIVLNKGEIASQGKPEVVFSDKSVLQNSNLKQPFIIDLLSSLNFSKEIRPKNMNDLVKVIQQNKGIL